MASRGTVFHYPRPLSVDDIGEPTDYSMKKVTLKFACGRCFHVFTVQTIAKITSQTRSCPCPFYGSLATTPVWEESN